MIRALAVAALALVPAAAADVTGDKWEGTWRVPSGALAGALVFKPATDAATRAKAPLCAGKKLYAGAYGGGKGTVAACAGGYTLAGRLYSGPKRIGDFSIKWELAVTPDGSIGAPTFTGSFAAGSSRGSWSGTWLRHGGTIPGGGGGGAPTAQQAVARVEAILRKNKARCELTWTTVVAHRIPKGYKVTANVSTFGNRGQASWNVVGTKMAPADQLASEIEVGCP